MARPVRVRQLLRDRDLTCLAHALTFSRDRRPDARIKVQEEYFERMRPMTLAALLETSFQDEESVYALGREDARSVAGSVRSVATSVVHSATEAGDSGPPVKRRNLLLLDARPPEDHAQWHILGAVSYPPTQLLHANNPLPRDIHYYKGPRGSGKAVVLYDEDGRTTPAMANALVEKGVENTYLLKGGLADFAPRFPHLLEGNVPPLPPPPPPSVRGLSHLRQRSSMTADSAGLGSPSAPPSTAGSMRRGHQRGGASFLSSRDGPQPGLSGSRAHWK